MAVRMKDGKARDAPSAFLRRMKGTLEALKEQILAKVAVEREEFHRLAEQHRIGDLPDRALEGVRKERLVAQELKDRERLRLVSSALVRMGEGRYGICENCGGKIARSRLEALPEALLCISCQRRLERGHSRT